MDYAELGRRIRQAREEATLSQDFVRTLQQIQALQFT